ncbi:MAG: cell division protein ZapA [Rhodobacter sp.]|nr:cell division protein ZapA [Rhodobacter sp.]
MPEVTIAIGGRDFTVACQDGEEQYLHAAAALLDTEATALTGQAGRLPENRMLLMSGLMLADKAAGLEDQLRAAEDRAAAAEAEAARLRNAPSPVAERVEVPVIPEAVTDSLAELAARAEALAETVEERAG